MNLREMLRDTDALTYINALKITLTEIKREVTEMKEMRDNFANACENIDKLVRKSDNQYRLISKIVNNHGSVVSELTIKNELDIDAEQELKSLMEE